MSLANISIHNVDDRQHVLTTILWDSDSSSLSITIFSNPCLQYFEIRYTYFGGGPSTEMVSNDYVQGIEGGV